MITKALNPVGKACMLALALAAGYAVSVITFGTDEAEAHTYASYYDRPWASTPSIRLGNLDYDLDGNSTRRANTLTATTAARNQWNNVPSGTMDFGSVYWNTSIVWTGSACTTASWGNVTIVSTNISPIGLASRCGTSSNITRTAIRVDYRNWNNTGLPTSTQYDYQALITHELGHATGFGDGPASHFSGSSTCPSSPESSRATMCSSMGLQDTWPRSLATHDKHTFDG